MELIGNNGIVSLATWQFEFWQFESTLLYVMLCNRLMFYCCCNLCGNLNGKSMN